MPLSNGPYLRVKLRSILARSRLGGATLPTVKLVLSDVSTNSVHISSVLSSLLPLPHPVMVSADGVRGVQSVKFGSQFGSLHLTVLMRC